MKRLFVCVAALAASLSAAAAQQGQPWRVGALYPLTRNLALLGNENLNGAKVAVEMINEAGGVGGAAGSTKRPAASPTD